MAFRLLHDRALLRCLDGDPAKVVRTARQDAASAAGLLVTTEAPVADRPMEKAALPAPAGPGS